MNKLTSIFLMLVNSLAFASDRPSVSQAHVLSLINAPYTSGYTLLDVRSSEEYQSGHIQSAINISHMTLSDELAKLPSNKDANIIVYCRSGRRAGIAEQILRKSGYTNVWHLTGDVIAWQESGLPLETGK